MKFKLIPIIFLLGLLNGCANEEMVVDGSRQAEKSNVSDNNETAEDPSESDEESCGEGLHFWVYGKITPTSDAWYNIENDDLNIRFKYEGKENIFYPISLLGEGENVGLSMNDSNFVRFFEESEAECLSDTFDGAVTKILLYKYGMAGNGASVSVLREELSKDYGFPLKTVKFGNNTYTELRTVGLGSRLVDSYAIEKDKDLYVLYFVWQLGENRNNWKMVELPEEYKTILETLEI